MRHPKKNKYTKEDKRNFERAKNCHICQQTLLQYGRQAKKAWDEDGNYLGEAHLNGVENIREKERDPVESPPHTAFTVRKPLKRTSTWIKSGTTAT